MLLLLHQPEFLNDFSGSGRGGRGKVAGSVPDHQQSWVLAEAGTDKADLPLATVETGSQWDRWWLWRSASAGAEWRLHRFTLLYWRYETSPGYLPLVLVIFSEAQKFFQMVVFLPTATLTDNIWSTLITLWNTLITLWNMKYEIRYGIFWWLYEIWLIFFLRSFLVELINYILNSYTIFLHYQACMIL